MRLVQYLTEAGGAQSGQSAGKLEIDNMTLEQAKEFASKGKGGIDIEKDVPHFDFNFKIAQKLARLGKTKRKDMPVIEDEDVKKFQKRLEDGTIDIHKPLAKDPLVKRNPFPTGLSGLDAKKWLSLGLKDGSIKDDQIDVRITKVKIKDLKPIQRQIYFDKAVGAIKEFGIESALTYTKEKSFFIISDDNYIIDGHHRWLSTLLLEPTASVNALKIKLPIDKLLPMATAYGDAIGNKRNA